MYLDKDTMYHIKLKKGQVGRYVLLPGDPFRTDIIAKYLDDPILVAHNREHKTWTGTLSGEKVSITSTGMGCPSAAIAVEELIACGADTFIRVGTAGRVNEASQNEKMIGGIITGAVRDEGTTKQYVPIEYPAIADRNVVEALVNAAKKLKYNFGEGITYTKDSFYSHVFPDMVPLSKEAIEKKSIWSKANILLTEMEASGILVVSALRGCRASGIMAFSDNKDLESSVDITAQIACEAIKSLIETDK
ncbi:MAG: uridine phosphorylase [Moraxellaceae bacterium]|nr:MAG: uridine phosphorylase [Moraxellaceae bacterium]